MIEFVLSLPVWFGGGLAMAFTTVLALAVYIFSHKLISRYQSGEIKDPLGSLFRVLAMLVSLMLSLAFADVTSGLKSIEGAIEREVVAISDTFHGLQQYGGEEAREIQSIVIEYTQAVIDDDWPALAHDRLGPHASALREELTSRVLRLEPKTEAQKTMWSRIIADVDAISDHRLTRLNNTLSTQPGFFYVIIFGFMITMACFGAHRPQAATLVLLALCTSFVGLVLYLVLSLSDPFQGAASMEPTTLEYLVESLRADLG